MSVRGRYLLSFLYFAGAAGLCFFVIGVINSAACALLAIGAGVLAMFAEVTFRAAVAGEFPSGHRPDHQAPSPGGVQAAPPSKDRRPSWRKGRELDPVICLLILALFPGVMLVMPFGGPVLWFSYAFAIWIAFWARERRVAAKAHARVQPAAPASRPPGTHAD